MTLRTVNYCVPCKLSCEAEDEVVLCLTGITVPSPVCPESVAQETYEYSHINGTIASVTCSKSTYKYVLTYDDADTSGVLLDPQNIDGVLCKGCYTRYVEELVGNEPYIRNDGEGIYTFVSPHGCEYELNTGEGAGITVSDTESVNLTLAANNISADVIISPDADNQLEERGNGLYVPASGGSITVADTASVNLTLTGSNLEADVIISADVGNQLEERVDGLYVPAGGGSIPNWANWVPTVTCIGPATISSSTVHHARYKFLSADTVAISVNLTVVLTGGTSTGILLSSPPGASPVADGQAMYASGFDNLLLAPFPASVQYITGFDIIIAPQNSTTFLPDSAIYTFNAFFEVA